LDAVVADVKAAGGHCTPVVFDITKLRELPGLIAMVHDLAGPVEVLVNNAGIERWGAFGDTSPEDMQAVFSTNLFSAMELTRLLLPDMVSAGRGCIVSIASMSGKKADAYNGLYSASKSAMIGWSDALRQELHGTGVSVSLVSPGPVRAGMFMAHGGDLPPLAAACPPTRVSKAVIEAIETGPAEIRVNAGLAPLLFAISEFFPSFGDFVYRLLGVPELNRRTAERMAESDDPPSSMSEMNRQSGRVG
jgi:short-subunit dehydrogenase